MNNFKRGHESEGDRLVGPGSFRKYWGEEEATVELHGLCLQYIRFSAVTEHSAWALSPSCHSAVNCKVRTVTLTYLSGAL